MGEGDVDPIGVIAKTLAWAALVAVAFIEIAFFDGSWDMGDVLHAIGPAWDSQTVHGIGGGSLFKRSVASGRLSFREGDAAPKRGRPRAATIRSCAR